jgi:hypothetical protein
MRRRTISPVGALHPILFFAGVYIVALFFSIFICSSLFYSCNTSSPVSETKTEKKVETNETGNTAVASLK